MVKPSYNKLIMKYFLTIIIPLLIFPVLLFSQTTPSIKVSDACINASTQFSLSIEADSAFWNFGDANSNSNNLRGQTVSHQYASTGKYSVKLNYYLEDSLYTLKKDIQIFNYPEVDDVADGKICEGELITRSVYAQNQISYSWSNGATGNIARLSAFGEQWVKATKNGCSTKKTFTLSQADCNTTITKTIPFEKGRDVTLWAPYAKKYTWSTGETKQGITITEPGNGDSYTLSITKKSTSAIKNGNFQKGYTSFTSDFSETTEVLSSGIFAVTGNASSLSTSVIKKAFDHTQNNGKAKFLATSFNSSGKSIWMQTVPVFQDKDYILKFWVRNIETPSTNSKILVKINNLDVFGEIETEAYSQWTQITIPWNSDINTSATIKIESASNSGIIGIDDISFDFNIEKKYKYILTENQKTCGNVKSENVRFSSPNSPPELSVQATNGCENIEWHSSDLFSSEVLGTSCNFTPATISGAQSFWADDKSDNGKYVKTTGYSFEDEDLESPYEDWCDKMSTTFSSKLSSVLKSVDIKITDCNGQSNKIILILKDKTNNSSISYSQFISCSNNSIIHLTPEFELNEGSTYELILDGTIKRKTLAYFIDRHPNEEHFSQEIEIISSGAASSRSFGPFFNWTIQGECPWTKVNAIMTSPEVCGDGIDNDGDGQTDENCSPFACNGALFQTMNKNLHSFVIKDLTFTKFKGFNFYINSSGFNLADQTIYAMSMDRAEKHKLLRIDAQKQVEILGYIYKPDNSIVKSFAADFDKKGTYYCIEQNREGGILYSVDIASMAATKLLETSTMLADIAVHPETQMIYGISSDKSIYMIDPDSKTETVIGAIENCNIEGDVSGLHFDPSGDLLAYGAFTVDYHTNDFVRINLESLEAIFLAKNKANVPNSDGCSCPYTLSMDKIASVKEVGSSEKFTYTVSIYNRTGETIEDVSFYDKMDWRISITDIVTDDFNNDEFSNSIGTNKFEVSNLDIEPGVSILKYEVELREGWYCPNKRIGNQARISNLPAKLQMGSSIVSDNPLTPVENDTTFTKLVKNWDYKVGKLNKTSIEKCGKINEDVSLTNHISEYIYWEHSTDKINWSQYEGTDFEEYTIKIDQTNSTQETVTDFLRARVGCRCDTQYVFLNTKIRPIPVIELKKKQSICEGDTIDAGPGYKTYKWSNGAETQKTVPQFTNTYTVTVTNTINCPNNSNTNVTVNPYADFEIPLPSRFCEGEDTDIGISEAPQQSYVWNTSDTTNKITINTDGRYILTVTQYGCVSSDTIDIETYKLPFSPALLSPTEICYNDTLPVLEATGNNLKWYNDKSLSELVNEGNSFALSSYKKGYLDEGEKLEFYLQSKDQNCKSSVSEISFGRNLKQTEVDILTEKDEFCQETEAVTFLATGVLDTIYWQLDNAEYNSRYSIDSSLLIADFYEAGTSTITAFTKDSKGCLYSNDIELTVRPLPMAKIDVSLNKETAIISNKSRNSSKTQYFWNLPEIYDWEQTTSFDTIIDLDFGNYHAGLRAINQYGCIQETNQNFYIHIPFELYIPNAFAPENESEGVNQFKVVSIFLDKFEITIFDNWGNTIWYSDALDEEGSPAEGWDGTYEGQKLPMGVYQWKINAHFKDDTDWEGIGESKAEIGSVMLIR